jgi:beta-lactamase superfamily II metal-dependent hydrolase
MKADAQKTQVHLLDVGPEEYADALICLFGGKTVMIDGAHPGDHRSREGHPSIPDQLEKILGTQKPHKIDLLIVSHAHQDHIGCLPKLIAEDIVRFQWALVSDPDLGWARASDENRDADIPDPRVRNLVAALRDECAPLSPNASDERIASFIADAVTLEETYRTMLDTLRARKTKIVRIGHDKTTNLQKAFASIGLRVIGPSETQALHCADLINRLSRDAADQMSDMFAADAALTSEQAYRRLTSGELDALDVSRPGPAVNLQSAVTTFEVGERRFLFAGDMQFEDPQVGDQIILDEVTKLRKRVKSAAPYALVKLSHHGSNNAFSEEILSELNGTALFGICAGEHSTHHPNPATLKVLNKHKNTIRWARTDRNGPVTMTFSGQKVGIQIDHGKLNDPQPNTEDVLVPEPFEPIPLEAPAAPEVVPATEVRTAAGSDFVEIIAKIPHVDTRVVISVEVSPSSRGATISGQLPEAPADALRIANGRALDRLLFVTNEASLAKNIGRSEAASVVAAVRAARMPLCLTTGNDVKVAAAAVRQKLRDGVAGVVIVGGHDVVPFQRIDCLPPDLRRRVDGSDDPDGFIVWSDDIYGDLDGDGLPELPVSRIPDGKSAELVFKAIRAVAPRPLQRAGIRNIARPFADGIYGGIGGTTPLLVSQPTVFNQRPALSFAADQLYFMLHGDYADGSRFWGEGTAANREAINISNLPQVVNGVVFTGCCWGALTTELPAGMVAAGRPVAMKTPESSIALNVLSRGARAFIGCTGAHYSPIEAPFNYFGGPMHRAFWKRYAAGVPPARALFDAKVDYIAGMPHGRSSAAQTAIEFKILRQYTCLGLGW